VSLGSILSGAGRMISSAPRLGQPRREEENQPGYWQGGEGFGWKDGAALALASIGDAFDANGGHDRIGMIMGNRNGAMERAREASAAAQAEARRQAERTEDRQWGNEDYATRQRIDAEVNPPPAPGSFGWYQTASEAERAVYDRYNPEFVATAQGPVHMPRRPALGTTERDPNAAPPSMQNTPAPQLGANGLPTELTRQQYQALVNESDGNAAAVDDYLARMGIQVRN